MDSADVNTGKYFISILVDQEVPEWVLAEHKLGIDLGISDFAVTTNDACNSVKHENPQGLAKWGVHYP
jgi:putative transposase